MRWLSAALLAIALAGPLAAEVLPVPGQIDRRIQTVTFNAEDVIRLRVALGYQVSLQFAPDERIESVAVGDSGAWQVTPNRRGDLLSVKLIQATTRTDMVVVTDARTYTFLLDPADASAVDLPFVVRFRYPLEVVSPLPANQPAARYTLRGDRAVRPTSISDDGQSTTISWAATQRLPAVFAVGSDGQETLVNGLMRDGALVISSVASRLIFRLNKQVAQADRLVSAEETR